MGSSLFFSFLGHWLGNEITLLQNLETPATTLTRTGSTAKLTPSQDRRAGRKRMSPVRGAARYAVELELTSHARTLKQAFEYLLGFKDFAGDGERCATVALVVETDRGNSLCDLIHR